MNIAEKISRAKADYDSVYKFGRDEVVAIMDNVLDMEEYGGLRDKGYITDNRPDSMISNAGTWWDEFLSTTDGTKMFANWKSQYILYAKYGHAVVVDTATIMFNNSCIVKAPEVDTSNVTNNDITNGGCQGMFTNCSLLEHIGVLDIRNASVRSAFNNCPKLTTIDKLIVSENTFFHCTFDSCPSLVEIRFEGIIGNPHGNQYPIRLVDCRYLSAESAISALMCLKDYSGTDEEYLYTIKLHNDIWNRIDAYSKSPNGGSWQDYVLDKGWNY